MDAYALIVDFLLLMMLDTGCNMYAFPADLGCVGLEAAAVCLVVMQLLCSAALDESVALCRLAQHIPHRGALKQVVIR